MTLSDVFMWFLIITGLMLVFICYWLASEALFPAVVGRARAAYAKPVKMTLIGAVIAVPLVFLAISIMSIKNPAVKLVGGTILATPIMLGLLGSSGLSQRIGCGLPSPNDELQPWKRVLRGGIILTFMMLLPFLGWFLVLPWALISGVGAAVTAIRGGRQNPQPAVAEAKAEVPFGAHQATP
ncbi:MAG: hypothetical protein AB1705_04305 [Verrucomicrobiota bacterium]